MNETNARCCPNQDRCLSDRCRSCGQQWARHLFDHPHGIPPWRDNPTCAQFEPEPEPTTPEDETLALAPKEEV